MKKRNRRLTAGTLAVALTATSLMLPTAQKEAEAAYTKGTAPYINTWLTAGPSDTSVVEKIYEGAQNPGDGEGEVVEGEKLNIASTEVSTTLSGSDKAYATDGDMETAWKSDTRQGVKWDNKLTMTLNLNDVAQITEIKINGFERDNKQLDVAYTLFDEDGITVKTLTQNDIVNDDFVTSSFTSTYNVKSIQVKIKEKTDAPNKAPNHLGIREIEVYGVPGKTDVPGNPEPDVKITPRLGEAFGDAKWEYFDDRVFNRNLDDWQDLHGYYTVKKGIATRDKYIYAHTYVYSPKKQTVNLRMVTSGLHKVYVNDTLVHENDTVVESTNKDQYQKDIQLKEGWNKVLIEVQHKNREYVGFYARLCDKDGNEVEGLEYSVMGDQAEELSIVTQGLDIDKAAFEERNKDIPSNMYPENELPYGYVDWPYVWNKPIRRTSSWASQASRFRFEAAGGNPDYTWEVVEGELPDGLTMDENGVIDGYCTEMGEYPFTLQVTDADGNKATKATKIVVKERPNKWFEEGKMSALSHDTGAYTQFYDENFSFDLWAERAKKAGMTMLSTEAVQAVYYWPAPGAIYANRQHPYTLDENGKPKDMVKLAKEAAERHGLRFGVYYASEGSNRLPNSNTNNSSGFVLNVEDLMKRYDPSYLFFDGGPQNKGNVDAMWSAVRAYNDYALIQANDLNEAGDNDITILENEYTGKMPYTYGGKWESNMYFENKYTVHESWTHPFFKEIDAWARYADGGHMRDDWRLWTEYIIYCIGHGSVANYDQMIINTRGVNWSGINFASGVKNEYYNLPLNAQEMIDLREKVNAWMANAGGPDLHESLFGTMPYYFDTYEKQSGWHDNTEKEPFLTAKYGEGPEWGYPVARDQYIYMHMQENTIGKGRAKKGFTGQDSIEAGPFDYKVTKVEWLNEGTELGFTPYEKDGKSYIKIDTSSVEADPIDTILKITTDNPKRDFQLTGVKLFADQTGGEKLSLRAEAYLKDFTSVFAPAELTYTSSNAGVAKVDQNGVVTPVGNGDATIKVVASYEGKTAEDTYAVKVKDGKVYAAEEYIGVVMRTDGKETFDKVSTNKNLPITFEARTKKGGGVDLLDYDNVTWHYATCDGQKDGHPQEADGYWHANQEVDSLDILKIENNEVVFNGLVPEENNVAIWADVTVDGKTYTTNKNYLRITPSYVLNEGVVPTVSSNEKSAKEVTDGILNSADGGNTSKWTPDKDDQTPTMTFELDKAYALDGVRLYFNNKDRYYRNRPRSVKVEVSNDKKEWTTVVESGEVPSGSTKYFYEDDKYTYPINQEAQYVRVSFPGGAAEDVMDILEVQILGADYANVLNRIDVEKTLSNDQTSIAVDVIGYNGKDEVVDLTDGTITITSTDDSIAVVEGNAVKAVAAGTAKITVNATLGGFGASNVFYVKVDEEGHIHLIDYVDKVDVTLNKNTIETNRPVVADIHAYYNTGEEIDLSNATVELVTEDANLALAEGTNVITMKNGIASSVSTPVQIRVTVDGTSAESKELALVQLGENVATGASIKVSSVRDKNGRPDGNDADSRYLGEKAIDGDRKTTWAAKQSDKSPWIELDLKDEMEITSVNLVDRGHSVNEIGEGKLEFFDAEGNLVQEQMVTGIKWDGQPNNVVVLDKPVTAQKIKFTIDPEQKYHQSGSERGLAEIQVAKANTEETGKIAAFGTVYMTTEAGKIPTLPEKVTAVYTDNTTAQVDVTWDEITDDMLKESGVVTVYGTVEGTELRAEARVKVIAAPVEPAKPANKTLLQATYDYAMTLSTDGVVDSAKAFFEKALANAKAVLDNENATQEEVNAAWDNLLEGIWGLGIVKGDKTMLEMLINRGDAMAAEKDRYVETNWQQLVDALAAAKDVMNNGDALEEDIQPAADALLDAILAQRYKANKDNLKGLIDKAEALDLSKYTKESVMAFRAALKAANAVMEDEGLSTDEQAKVDKAAKELQIAIDGLKLASNDGNDNENGSGNDKNANNGNVDKANNEASRNTTSNTGKDAPKTGDTMNVAVWLMLMAAVVVAVEESVRRRRR